MPTSSLQTATIAATCFGVSIGIKCRPTDASAVSTHLPIGSKSIGPDEAGHHFALEYQGRNLFSVRCGSSKKTSPPQEIDAALKILQKEIYICVAEHSKTHVFIHAGVVAWENRSIILPGSSFAGKSTLVWSLLQAGATYYSDEYAVFDKHGYIHPFPVPVGLRLRDGTKRMIVPDKIGSAPLKPDVVVFARYRPGAEWRPRTLMPAAAVLKLIRHSIGIRCNPNTVLPILKHVSLQAHSFSGVRGDSNQLLSWIRLLPE